MSVCICRSKMKNKNHQNVCPLMTWRITIGKESHKNSGEISEYSTENSKGFFPYKFFCIFRISKNNRSSK